MSETPDMRLDAAALFRHLSEDLLAGPSEPQRWEFAFRPSGTEKLQELAESLGERLLKVMGPVVAGEPEDLSLGIQESVPTHYPDGRVEQGPPLISFGFTAALTEEQLAALHREFAEVAASAGVEYEGVECYDAQSHGEMMEMMEDGDNADDGPDEGPPDLAALDLPDSDAGRLRRRTLEKVVAAGFRPALWLPLPDADAELRPTAEIVGRLRALAAVFAWASAPEDAVATADLDAFAKHEGTWESMTPDEQQILGMERADARATHQHSVGWRLENVWALAWVLGGAGEPPLDAGQASGDRVRAMLVEFVGLPHGMPADLAARVRLRPAAEVVALEDLHYVAHNAVRSAQLSNPACVPAGFEPLADGGTIHERRHALTWALSPGVCWDETDLST